MSSRDSSGPRISVSLPSVLLFSALFYLDSQNLMIYFVAAAVLHECGHFLAVKLCGGRIEMLRLSLIGAEIVLAGTPMLPHSKEVAIALAGPAMSVLGAAAASLLGTLLFYDDLYVFAGVSLLLGLFNLLPVRILDGGRAISSILELHLGQERADSIAFLLSLLGCMLITSFGVYVFMSTGYNITMLFIAVFLSCSLLIKSEIVKSIVNMSKKY